MNIRFAQKKDLPQIIALCQAHADFEQAAYDPVHKAELLAKFLFGQHPSLQCFVVVQENSIVGYATFMKQFSTWDADFYLYLDCLFLKEHTRGQGLGRRLMEKITSYAKNVNCERIEWQTPTFNQKAIDFYQNLGGVSKTKERFCLPI